MAADTARSARRQTKDARQGDIEIRSTALETSRSTTFQELPPRPTAPVLPCTAITSAERAQLSRWVRARTSPHRLVIRSRIVLLASDGLPVRDIAARLQVTRSTVRLWCRRFDRLGVAALARDAPGRGRPRGISPSLVITVLRAMRDRRNGAAAWTARSLAAHAGISATTVWRVWKRFGLGPASADADIAVALARAISETGEGAG